MDLESGNLVGSYLTLEDALEVVRAAFIAYGEPGTDDLGLLKVECDGSQEFIAAGSELVTRAMADSVIVGGN